MRNFEKRLQRLEDRISSVSWAEGGTATFETKDGETVEISKSEVMEVYEAASKKAWNNELPDREDGLFSKVLNAKDGKNIGAYLRSFIEGENPEVK